MPSGKERLFNLRIQGRFWQIFRAVLFIPIIVFIWMESNYLAALFVSISLVLGWINLYQLRVQEVEEPYFRLWLNFVDGLLSFVVMFSIFIRDTIKDDSLEKMLAVGCVFLFVRFIAYTLFSLGIIREGNQLPRRRSWTKLASLSITVTMAVYVLNLEYYMQICMGASLLLMGASGLSFIYWYYRDPTHRKPLSLASQITVSRIVLTPVFLWVFFYDNDLNYSNNNLIFKVLALAMVAGFMLTDFLDGYLARKMGDVTTLGKYLDPFSDKISNMTVFLCFIATGYAPVWMVALIYFREASVETLRTLAASENVVIPARKSGKWKTAIQGAGILLILIGTLDPVARLIPNYSSFFESFPTYVMGLITAITLISGVDYFMASRHILKKFV